MQKKQSLLKQFFHFSAATVASLMVFSLYSIVDGLFVARGVGEYAMTAVNLSKGARPCKECYRRLLPIGISFYVFQSMSYIIDVYRQDAPVQRNPLTFGT